MSYYGAQRAKPYPVLEGSDTRLEVRQHPQQALITLENKEKTRKAVDPPPIVQLKVNSHGGSDQGNWLVNPFLFMNVILVESELENGAAKPVTGAPLLGQTVSSLHRLKDVNNKDGGFFVFGDISCRCMGTYRLQFNLFDYDKITHQAVWVSHTLSDPFNVVSPKEFRGQSESTHLSRTFSDQGVRLRLRKEQRSMAGAKRAFGVTTDEPSTTPVNYNSYGGPIQDRQYGYSTQTIKRQRSDSDYNPQMMYPSQIATGSLFPYSASMQSGSSGHSLHTISTDDASSFAGMMGSSHGSSAMISDWPRRTQQGPLSAPIESVASNSYMSYSHASAPLHRSHTGNGYAQHHSQQSPLRTSTDSYSALGGLQTPASLPDTTLGSNHHQSYLPSNADVPSHVGSMNLGPSSAYSIQGQHDPSSTQSQFDFRNSAPNSSLSDFQARILPTVTSAAHDQYQTRSAGQYDQSNFNNAGDLYSDSSREAFSSNAGSFSDAGLSVLSRGFMPPLPDHQQSSLHTSPGQNMAGFKQPPYPTPHQTSPM